MQAVEFEQSAVVYMAQTRVPVLVLGGTQGRVIGVELIGQETHLITANWRVTVATWAWEAGGRLPVVALVWAWPAVLRVVGPPGLKEPPRGPTQAEAPTPIPPTTGEAPG